MIEALLLLRANSTFWRMIPRVRVEIAPRWQNVCDIKAPSTGSNKIQLCVPRSHGASWYRSRSPESYLDSHCDDADLVA